MQRCGWILCPTVTVICRSPLSCPLADLAEISIFLVSDKAELGDAACFDGIQDSGRTIKQYYNITSWIRASNTNLR